MNGFENVSVFLRSAGTFLSFSSFRPHSFFFDHPHHHIYVVGAAADSEFSIVKCRLRSCISCEWNADEVGGLTPAVFGGRLRRRWM